MTRGPSEGDERERPQGFGFDLAKAAFGADEKGERAGRHRLQGGEGIGNRGAFVADDEPAARVPFRDDGVERFG